MEESIVRQESVMELVVKYARLVILIEENL